jgi:hypothetical protein
LNHSLYDPPGQQHWADRNKEGETMAGNRAVIGLAALAAGLALGQGVGIAQVCPPAPAACRTALSSTFTFKDRADNNNDRLTWRWKKGQQTTDAEFLDPTTTVTTALCLYAGTAASLISESTVPPSPTLWHIGDNGKIWYKDPTASNDAIRYVLLRSGAAGAARIVVKGRGSALPDLTLPFTGLPLIVQLHQDDGTPCWGSTFSTASVNTDKRLKARSP